MDVNILHIDRSIAADFLIVYVTSPESDAVDSILEPVCEDGILNVDAEGRKYKLGKIGGYNVVCCRCKPGTIGSDSATLTVVSALQDWPDIKGVFMPGICYGVLGEEEDKQHRSDVIASEKVFAYEQQEKGDGIEYKIDKSSVFKANKELVSAFEEANTEWNHTNRQGKKTSAYKGSYLSGNVRFTAKSPIEELKEDFTQVSVGDMEGHGLASACDKFKKPWLLMKGISDFGDRDEEEKEYQKDAAFASAKALLNILNNTESEHIKTIIPKGSVNFYYHGIKHRINDIFFRQYAIEVEQYYVERDIDRKLTQLIKTGCCWIYGKSGVGKSVSISRALMKNNIHYVLCDLSRYVHMPVEVIFKHIYEQICMSTDEIPKPNLEKFEEITEQIFAVVRNKYPNGELYVLIEEIPYNFDSEQFKYFLEKMNAMLISGNIHLGNSRLQIVLSTIESPKTRIEQWQSKVLNTMRYVEMKKWTIEECRTLVGLLSKTTNLKWGEEYSMDKFIATMDYSPDRIKKALNDLISMDVYVVDEEMVEIVNMI